jgi:hypothetical protein
MKSRYTKTAKMCVSELGDLWCMTAKFHFPLLYSMSHRILYPHELPNAKHYPATLAAAMQVGVCKGSKPVCLPLLPRIILQM